jgi:hypothetical protein
MTEVLRAQIKEKLIAANLCSDGGDETADTTSGANAGVTAMTFHTVAMRISTVKEAADTLMGTPPTTSRKNVRCFAPLFV